MNTENTKHTLFDVFGRCTLNSGNGFTLEEQKNITLSLEEFVKRALKEDANLRRIPLWIYGDEEIQERMPKDYSWRDVYNKTIASMESMGFEMIPVPYFGSQGEGSGDKGVQSRSAMVIDAVRRLTTPNVALYISGCFCCGGHSQIFEQYKNGVLGIVATKEHLTKGSGQFWSLPRIIKQNLSIDGTLAVRDPLLVLDDYINLVETPENANYFRIQID